MTQGGVAAAALAGCAVRLVQEDRIVTLQAVDDLGHFAFDQLPAGAYELWIELSDVDVVVRDVVVDSLEERK